MLRSGQIFCSSLVFHKMLEDGVVHPAELANAALNGREIKNALRLAMAMASEKKESLSQAILLETVEIVNDYKVSMANPYAHEDDDGTDRGCCFFPWWGKVGRAKGSNQESMR